MAEKQATRRGFLRKLGMAAAVAGVAPVLVYDHSEARPPGGKKTAKKKARKKAAKKKTHFKKKGAGRKKTGKKKVRKKAPRR